MTVSDAVQSGTGGRADRLLSGASKVLATQGHPFFKRSLVFTTHRDSVGRPRLAAFTQCDCEE